MSAKVTTTIVVDHTPQEVYTAIDAAYDELVAHAEVCTSMEGEDPHGDQTLDKSLRIIGEILYHLEGVIK